MFMYKQASPSTSQIQGGPNWRGYVCVRKLLTCSSVALRRWTKTVLIRKGTGLVLQKRCLGERTSSANRLGVEITARALTTGELIGILVVSQSIQQYFSIAAVSPMRSLTASADGWSAIWKFRLHAGAMATTGHRHFRIAGDARIIEEGPIFPSHATAQMRRSSFVFED